MIRPVGTLLLRAALIAWLAILLLVPAHPADAQQIVNRPRATQASPVGLQLAPSTLLPAGSTYVWVGDGLASPSGGVGPGASNPVHVFQGLAGGRLQGVGTPFLAQSGTSFAGAGGNSAWQYPTGLNAAFVQYPDVLILSGGHNDNVISENPATGQGMADWKMTIVYAVANLTTYGIKQLRVVGTQASALAGETTWRTAAWAEQKAFVDAITATDPRVVFVPVDDLLPATSYSIDAAGAYTHWDERGAAIVASRVLASLNLEAKTPLEIADMIFAGTYPLMSGAVISAGSDRSLSGTGGTITGPGITGTLATSAVIQNNTGATGISVAQVATTAGRTKTVVTLSGTASSTGRVYIQSKTTFPVTASPGQFVRTGAILRAPASRWSLGAGYNYGTWGGGGFSFALSPNIGAAAGSDFEAVVFANEQALYGAGPTYNGQAGVAVGFKSGAALSGTMEYEQPFAYLVSDRQKGAPVYLGELQNAGGGMIFSTNFRMGLTGAVSAATGGSPVIRPGTWNLRGFTNSDFVARRIYKGGGSGGVTGQSNLGAGALLATLSGSTWTASIAGGAAAQGDLLYVEIDCNNGIGGTVTYRSVLALVVAA